MMKRVYLMMLLSLLIASAAYASDIKQTSSRRVPASNRHYKDAKVVIAKPQLPPGLPVTEVAKPPAIETPKIAAAFKEVKEEPKPAADTPEVVAPKVVPENKPTEIKLAVPPQPKEPDEKDLEQFNDKEGAFPLDQPAGTDTREK